MVPQVKQEASIASPIFVDPHNLDSSALPRMPWSNDYPIMDDSVDFTKPIYGFSEFNAYDAPMMVGTLGINPHDPMMPDWNSNSNEMEWSHFMTT